MKSNINEKSNTEKEAKRYILVDDSDNRIIDSGSNQAVIEIGAKQYIKNAIKSGKNASVSCYTYVKTIGTDNGEVSESIKKGSKSTMKLRISEGRTMPYVLWVLDGDDRQWKMYKGVNDARKFVAENDYDEFLDELNTQVFPNGTYYNNYIDWVVIPAGENPKTFDTHRFYGDNNITRY